MAIPSTETIVSIGASVDFAYLFAALGLLVGTGEKFRVWYNILLRIIVWGCVFLTTAFVERIFSSSATEATVESATTTALFVVPCVVALCLQSRREIVEGGPAPTFPVLKDNTVIVITGANAGIGKATVRSLVESSTSSNVTIYMLCRNTDKGEAAAKDILEHSVQPSNAVSLQVVECDLGSLSSVRQAVDRLKSSTTKVDFLINNAGIMLNNLRYTDDGHEEGLQANHLGHFLLTSLLLPIIKDRVILLTSSTYFLAAKNFPYNALTTTLMHPPSYSMFHHYAATKWCNILHALYLQQHLHFPAVAVHPGIVRTDVVRHMSTFLRVGYRYLASGALALLQKTPAQGAWGTLHAMQMDGSGGGGCCCWVNRQPLALKVEPTKEQIQKVWDWSCDTVELTEEERKAMETVGQDREKEYRTFR